MPAAACRLSVTGRFVRDLPAVKGLRAHYGCSHPIIRAALTRLTSECLIRREGTSYRVSLAGRTTPSSARVYCLAGRSRETSGNVQAILMGVEREMESHGWPRLRYVLSRDREQNMPKPHQVAGFLHFQLRHSDPWIDFLSQPMAAPAVIIDNHEAGRAAGEDRPNLYRIFPDNTRAGSEVGHHLGAAGHQRCAYMSFLPTTEGCCRLRLEGLSQVFARAGGERGRQCRVFDWTDKEILPLTGPAEAEAMLEQVRTRMLNESRLNTTFVTNELAGAFGALHWWRHYTTLYPLFESVLNDRSLTAWVCSTDTLAMLAHTFLCDKGLVPGGDIALVSFDNSQLAQTLDITSYDFGFDGMGRLAFYCLAMPGQVSRKGRSIVHSPGQLVSRGTSGSR